MELATLDAVVNNARKLLLAHPEHQLTLASQVDIWHLLASDEDEDAVILRAYRRISLEIASVEIVLPIWDRHSPHAKYPHMLIEEAELLLMDKNELSAAEQLASEFYIEWIDEFIGQFPQSLIIRSAFRVLHMALFAQDHPELIVPDSPSAIRKPDEYELDLTTPSELCADAFSGGILHEPASQSDLRLKFWSLWLDNVHRISCMM